MVQSLFILSFLLSDFPLNYTVTLSVEPATRHPLILIDLKENIWYQDYWGHSITKMSPTGSVLFQLKGPGKGPGELEKPTCFTLVDDGQILLVHHSQTRLMAYNASSGKFIKEISRKFVATRIFPWDKNSFLALKDPTGVGGPGFELFDYHKATSGKAWYRRAQSRSPFTASWFAFAQGTGNTLYYQPGEQPEINVFKAFEATPHIWKLKPPPGYIKPPEAALPEKDRYNRLKVDAYYNSYTQVRSFALLKDKMIVCWFHPEPERFYYQIYDPAKETVVQDNLPVRGQLISVVGAKLFSLARADLDDLGKNGKERVFVYGSK